MTQRMGIARLGHLALSTVQGIFGLFSAGTVLFEAHRLFLWYYAREWQGVQLSGVNECAGQEAIANGDLFSGTTLCNQPENLVPWVEVYRHHIGVAVAYYGVILAGLFLIAVVWYLFQNRRRIPDPRQQEPHGIAADDPLI